MKILTVESISFRWYLLHLLLQMITTINHTKAGRADISISHCIRNTCFAITCLPPRN